jgi:hypothetical protein
MEVAVKLTDEELQRLRTASADNVRSVYLERQARERTQINAIIDELLAARKVVDAARVWDDPWPVIKAAIDAYDKVAK